MFDIISILVEMGYEFMFSTDFFDFIFTGVHFFYQPKTKNAAFFVFDDNIRYFISTDKQLVNLITAMVI